MNNRLRDDPERGRGMNDTEETAEGSATLPTISGLTKEVTNSAPFKALLHPAMKVFGTYLGERAAEVVAGWQKKRESNVRHHAEIVNETEQVKAPRELTEKEALRFWEWVEGAEQVDPEDAELSAVWQSLLGAIYRKEDYARDYLQIAKQLDERDARLLLNLSGTFSPDSSREKAQATKLARLEVLDGKDWSTVLPRVVLPGGLLIIAVIAGLFIPPQWRFQLIPIPQEISQYLSPGVFLAILAYAIYNVATVNTFWLTPLGKQIQESALRYLSKQRKHTEVASNEE
jgi:hypothetical protein